MSETYIPPSGFAGKLRRLAARRLARAPLKIELDRALVSFTFDDFPASAATTGADMLESFGWRGTYFASAGFAGGETHLGKMFETRDLLRLHHGGHEIGCHTYGHGDASRLDAKEIVTDCVRNRRCLEIMGHEDELTSFAFPYGEASLGAKPALLGRYRALRGIQPGVNRGVADRGLLKACPLDGGRAGLARALDQVRDAVRQPGWLIFYGHDVRNMPGQWGCTPEFLKSVCTLAADLKCEVLPMREALDRIEAPRAEAAQ